MSFSETISPFLGRCAFVWFYLTSAADIMANWHAISAVMDAKHIPIPPLMLLLALLIVFMGVISLFFGYHTRYGAVMLFAVTISAAFGLHDYWHYADAGAHTAQFNIFIRDFAICGGLLLMVGMGPGPFAIDYRGKGGGGGKGRR